jgi:hypothetical protein
MKLKSKMKVKGAHLSRQPGIIEKVLCSLHPITKKVLCHGQNRVTGSEFKFMNYFHPISNIKGSNSSCFQYKWESHFWRTYCISSCTQLLLLSLNIT